MADVEIITSKIRNCKLFNRHTESELSFIANILECEAYSPGQIVFSEGDIGYELFIVASGDVHVTQTIASDRKMVREIAILKEGSFFGEMAVIDQAPRSATATVVTDTQLYVLDGNLFHEHLEKGEPAISKIWREVTRILSLRVRTVEDVLGDMIYRTLLLSREASGFPSVIRTEDIALLTKAAASGTLEQIKSKIVSAMTTEAKDSALKEMIGKELFRTEIINGILEYIEGAAKLPARS